VDTSAPKVSIVLPTYNGARYLEQSIDSCLHQTHRNIELIMVDDHSADKTPQIIKSYTDPRVRYLRHETNKGLPHALNTGFAHATGEYLTWTSDDNLYAENAIELMLKFLQREQCGLVYCDYYEFKEDNLDLLELVRLPDKPALDRINCVRACFLYPRQVQDAVGIYDHDTLLCEDYDYWIRVSHRFRLGHLAEPLYFYRRHGGALYSRRYWEVEVVKFLVRLKYNIMDVREVADALIRQMARRWNVLRCPYRLKRFIAEVAYSKRIHGKLTDFKEGRITFAQLRADLNTLVNGKPVEA
jgi:glycosyltransferase involved in cell wall biosynthesis